MLTAEIQTALIGLVGAVIGGGISSITTLVIARNERKKFARERLWDLRREGYSQIVSSLRPAVDLLDQIRDGYAKDPVGYDASTGLEAAADMFAAKMRAARETFNEYRLVSSAVFASRFEEMERALKALTTNPLVLPPELAARATEIVTTASRALLSMATEELRTGMVEDL